MNAEQISFSHLIPSDTAIRSLCAQMVHFLVSLLTTESKTVSIRGRSQKWILFRVLLGVKWLTEAVSKERQLLSVTEVLQVSAGAAHVSSLRQFVDIT